MKERIIKTLESYLIQNKDVLTKEEIKDIEKQIRFMKKSVYKSKLIKILSAEAVYTGGGIYIYYGKLSDGTYFRACDDWDWIEICDYDTSVEDADYEEFYEEHSIKTLTEDKYERFWNTMLKKIIKEDKGGNYCVDELEARLI